MTDILPTHTCFDDALEYLDCVLKSGDEARLFRVRVVHGICLAPEGPLEGQPFAHAWIEEDGAVIQAGMANGTKVYYGMDRAEFYALLRVQTATRYSSLEAMEQNVRTGHFGPWESSYRDMIKPGDRTVFQ